jgi:hypothetical protein
MNSYIIILLVFSCLGVSVIQKADPLKKYQWKNRIILIIGDKEDSLIKKQHEILSSDTAGLMDRDIRSFTLDEDTMGEWESVREEYASKGEAFTFILIGKDGGEKWRTNELASLEELFSRIDSMPMRQSEMRNNGQ